MGSKPAHTYTHPRTGMHNLRGLFGDRQRCKWCQGPPTMNTCWEDGGGPGGVRAGAKLRTVPLTSQSLSHLPQGWTHMEAAAVWGAAQQANGRSLYGQGLEDLEAKAPPRPQGHEAETPGKVTGPGTSQSTKGWGLGASSPRRGQERETCSHGQGRYPPGITCSQHLPAFPCPPGVLCDSEML